MPIPKNINREHVIEAIRKVDREGVPERRESTRFSLSYEGKYYSPKYVISLANIFANGEEYSPSMFSGGSETNNFLRGLGFSIVENEMEISEGNKKSLLVQFHKDMLNIYEEARKVGYNASRFKQMVANKGGFNVAKKFIQSSNASDGFVSLWELKRLDLTVEALVLKEKYKSLFTEEEREIVISRLEEYGFKVLQDINPPKKDVNTWIFQGNPSVFDINNYISEHKHIWWSLRQEHFADKIQINDNVFLWRSDGGKRGTGGIIAKCKIVSLPLERADGSDAEEYWYTDDWEDSYLAVKLEVLEVRIGEEFISRLSLLENPVLKDLLILRLRQQTNYLLSQKHAIELQGLWESKSSFRDELKNQVSNDIETAINNEITDTEKEQVIKSRIGQSAFKKALLAREKKCRLCGVSDERFLVASHIKPWSQSDNQERLDVNNGLLLCPNHDSLFDKGYTTFDDDGRIMISDDLDDNSKLFLNINDNMKISMNESQQQYMKWHRENLFEYK